MSFFSNLRRVNKVYPNNAQFISDNVQLITSTPAGFTNVLSAPTVRQIGTNRFVPGYNLSNNQFISTADINRITRNNDVSSIRNVFRGISDPQVNSLGQLRRMDNVPDFTYHGKQMRTDAIKQNYPSTNTRTPDGVDQALRQNPRLNNYMQGLKAGGIGILLGTGGYFIFSAATLVQDIINALNNTGGSYWVRGKNGGEQADVCLLLDRTCMPDPNMNESAVAICSMDPIFPNNNSEQLRNMCQGFNYELEQTVCRASDPNADPDSLQYVDISDLPTGQTIMCIEPYSLADLVGDLGLDWLLGDEGLIDKSSNSSDSLSNKLMPIILLIGGILFLGLIFYFIYRYLIKNNITATGGQLSAAAAGGPTNIIIKPSSS
ncbi:ODV-E56 [Lonomia obliqua multiple nucleopolyhedrovirus]|uniref:ODV-E56 n=1 Tax=Lonomia obliqua multiple nucleopolyhedrovirus TaxID=134394 RepID=A0A126FC96_9ABAC|nr:ODV-E56 [Lonomia obliqua multiple nucleopolyhedrovirus]AKN81024.1 ODV-E56 [Lonomia obliqua multiple nucleopolyhedrovirus]